MSEPPVVTPQLVLASTSAYRRELLQRLKLPFKTAAPHVDETPLIGEAPHQLVGRLARAKARAVLATFPGHIVLGCDQVAVCGEQILGKPGDRARAQQQLAACAGRTVQFLTAVCVTDGAREHLAVVPTEVKFRTLDAREIARYVEHDQPLDCAGALKSEQLGVALCERMTSDDPTALIGLPLITVCGLLAKLGFDVLERMSP